MSAEELLRLPDDGSRHELIEGRLILRAPAGAEHGDVSLQVGMLLRQHVRGAALGRTFGAETGFRLANDPDTVRAPDVAFVARERAEREGRVEGFWPGAPDLAVEVVSPGDGWSEVHAKALGWLSAGTRLVLVADPVLGSVTAYRPPASSIVLTGDEVVDCDDVVAGLRIPARTLFA